MPEYIVIDSPFNRAWNKPLIGKRFTKPPSYTEVKPVDTATERAGQVLALLGLVGLPALVGFSIYLARKR
jgi:hypothetical protein